MVSAQTSKSLWMVGGNLGFNRYEDGTSFNITPNGGYLFTDHFSAGLSLNFSGNFSEYGKGFSTTFSPYGRYYFLSGKTQPFILASAGFDYTKYDSDKDFYDYHLSEWNFRWNAAMGVSHFLNKNAAIEGMIGYNGNVNISFGLQIFLGTEKD